MGGQPQAGYSDDCLRLQHDIHKNAALTPPACIQWGEPPIGPSYGTQGCKASSSGLQLWGTYVELGLPWLMKGTSDLRLMGCVHGCLWACAGVAQGQGPMLFMLSCTSIKTAQLAVLPPDPLQGESAATTHAETGALQAAQHARRTCVHTLLEQIQQQDVSIFSCIQAGKNC